MDRSLSFKNACWYVFSLVVKIILFILLCIILAVLFFDLQRIHREVVTPSMIPPIGRLIHTSDANIFVQESGSSSDPAVVLIHGTGTWSQIWEDTIPVLAQAKYHVIAIDLPPFGYSEKLSGSSMYDRSHQAKRIVEVLDALHIKQATLVGHSVGARPTIEVALSYPTYVDKLILVDPAVGFGASTTDATYQQNNASWLIQTIFSIAPLRNALISTYGTNPLFIGKLLRSFVFNTSSITPERIALVQEPMKVQGTTAAYGDWLKYLMIDKDTSLGSDFTHFKNLHMPVAMIWGNEDVVTPLWQGKLLQTLIPNSNLIVVPHVGHIPYIEDVPTFNSILLQLLHT